MENKRKQKHKQTLYIYSIRKRKGLSFEFKYTQEWQDDNLNHSKFCSTLEIITGLQRFLATIHNINTNKSNNIQHN